MAGTPAASRGGGVSEKVKGNINKGEGYPVSPFKNSMFGVSIGKTYVIVDMVNKTCTCKA